MLATDETAYVWSNQSKPITKQANAGLNTTETTAKIENDLKMESGGAILIEQHTGQVLYEHNMHEKLIKISHYILTKK